MDCNPRIVVRSPTATSPVDWLGATTNIVTNAKTAITSSGMKKLFLWIASFFAVWFLLANVEHWIIARFDKQIRSDQDVFLGYIDRLPPVLGGANNRFRFHCEYLPVGVFWTYKTCFGEIGGTLPEPSTGLLPEQSTGCVPPFFRVYYYPPRPNLSPSIDTTQYLVFGLEKNKSICNKYDISEY